MPLTPDIPTLLTALALALVGSAAVAALRGRPLTRRERQRRWRRRQAAGDAEGITIATFLQARYDALPTLERTAADATRLTAHLARYTAELTVLRVALDRAKEVLEHTRDRLRDEVPPRLRGRVVHLANAVLLLGDAAVVSTVFIGTRTSPAEALIKTVAFSVTMWVAGKLLGEVIEPQDPQPFDDDSATSARAWTPAAAIWSKFALALVAMAVCAAALGSQVESDNLAWAGLILVPALGSAIVTILSTNGQYAKLHVAEHNWRKARHDLRRTYLVAAWWFPRAEKRVARLDMQVHRRYHLLPASIIAHDSAERGLAAANGEQPYGTLPTGATAGPIVPAAVRGIDDILRHMRAGLDAHRAAYHAARAALDRTGTDPAPAPPLAVPDRGPDTDRGPSAATAPHDPASTTGNGAHPVASASTGTRPLPTVDGQPLDATSGPTARPQEPVPTAPNEPTPSPDRVIDADQAIDTEVVIPELEPDRPPGASPPRDGPSVRGNMRNGPDVGSGNDAADDGDPR